MGRAVTTRQAELLERFLSLYTPPDLLAANAAWKANCGPGALAAVLGMPVMKLYPLFRGRFPSKPWTTPTMMQAALSILGERVHVSSAMPAGDGPGLLFLQLRGAWDNKPDVAQYRHTHWVGFVRRARLLWVYDVNAAGAGAWLPSELWKSQVLAEIVARHPGASGLWRVRTALELRA